MINASATELLLGRLCLWLSRLALLLLLALWRLRSSSLLPWGWALLPCGFEGGSWFLVPTAPNIVRSVFSVICGPLLLPLLRLLFLLLATTTATASSAAAAATRRCYCGFEFSIAPNSLLSRLFPLLLLPLTASTAATAGSGGAKCLV